MKKKYVRLEFEIIHLERNDVISTSDQGVETPDVDPGNPFVGGYDKFGWT